jgi:hypothetical protein
MGEGDKCKKRCTVKKQRMNVEFAVLLENVRKMRYNGVEKHWKGRDTRGQ